MQSFTVFQILDLIIFLITRIWMLNEVKLTELGTFDWWILRLMLVLLLLLISRFINRSGLRVSNSKVFSSVHIISNVICPIHNSTFWTFIWRTMRNMGHFQIILYAETKLRFQIWECYSVSVVWRNTSIILILSINL